MLISVLSCVFSLVLRWNYFTLFVCLFCLVCVCPCMHLCVSAHACVCVSACACLCVHVCVCACMHVCVCVRACVRACVCVCVCVLAMLSVRSDGVLQLGGSRILLIWPRGPERLGLVFCITEPWFPSLSRNLRSSAKFYCMHKDCVNPCAHRSLESCASCLLTSLTSLAPASAW